MYFVAVVVAAYKVAWQSQFHGHFLALLRQDTSLSLSLCNLKSQIQKYTVDTNNHFTNTKIQFLALLCKDTFLSLKCSGRKQKDKNIE